MILPESMLVVLACTLSGGFDRQTRPGGTNETCGVGTRWVECGVLDEGINPQHVALPWAVTLCAIVVLSMPTVLLRSSHKEKALSKVASNLLQCLGLMLCSSFVTDHPSICFALSLHSCVLLLGHMDVSAPQVGAVWWWGLRHLVALGLLAWEVVAGPPLSVVRWPGCVAPASSITVAPMSRSCTRPSCTVPAGTPGPRTKKGTRTSVS